MRQLLAALIFGLCTLAALSGAGSYLGATPLEHIAEQIIACVHPR